MIDWDRVAQLRKEIGPEDFLEVVELFIDEVEEVTKRLSTTPDLAKLEEDLHFLKGSALNLGFEDFGAMCQEGERLAARGAAKNVDIGRILKCYEVSRQAFLSAEEGRAVA